MASVRPARSGKPDRWEARIYTGLDPLTARPRYTSRTITASGRRQAEREASRIELDLYDHGHSDGGTLTQLLDDWITHRSRRWAPSTLAEHRRIVDRHLRHTPLARLPVDRITTRDIDRLYDQLAARGGACTHRPCTRPPCDTHGPRCQRTGCVAAWTCPTHQGACANWTPCGQAPCPHGGPLSTATVARIHVVVRSALQQAIVWGSWGLRRNPAQHADPGAVVTDEVTPPGREDVIALLARAEALDPRLACHLAVAVETGARRGAMHALRWSDWTGPRPDGLSELRFDRVVTISQGGLVERQASRTKRGGRATLGPHVTAALAAHHDHMFARAMSAGAALQADAHMWSDDVLGRRPWRPDSTSRRFRQVRGDAPTRLHDLRHLMATQLLAAGVPARTVADRGGWGQLHTMLSTYAHSTPATDSAAAGVLDRLLNPEDR